MKQLLATRKKKKSPFHVTHKGFIAKIGNCNTSDVAPKVGNVYLIE